MLTIAVCARLINLKMIQGLRDPQIFCVSSDRFLEDGASNLLPFLCHITLNSQIIWRIEGNRRSHCQCQCQYQEASAPWPWTNCNFLLAHSLEHVISLRAQQTKILELHWVIHVLSRFQNASFTHKKRRFPNFDTAYFFFVRQHQ